jgi:hypothetical protein
MNKALIDTIRLAFVFCSLAYHQLSPTLFRLSALWTPLTLGYVHFDLSPLDLDLFDLQDILKNAGMGLGG